MSSSVSAPADEVFVDLNNKPVTEGTRLFCWDWWGREGRGVRSCYLWQVVRSPQTGQLLLMAEGIKKRLPLTHTRLEELFAYSAAQGVSIADFPEQWNWWRAHGWGVLLRNARGIDGEMVEFLGRKGEKICSMTFEPGAWTMITKHPVVIQRILGEALYYLLHPRKGRALGVLGEDRMPDEVYLPFAEQQRRLVEKLGLS